MRGREIEPGGHRDAVFGLARAEGCTLMVRNDRVSGGGRISCWDLPGGAVRTGERLAEALEREWREETGLTMTAGDLRLVTDGIKRRPGRALLYTWRAFFFDARCRGRPVAGEGIDEAAWVPDEDVIRRLDAPYHAALVAHLRGARARHACVEWIEEAPPEAAPGSGALGVPRRLLIVGAAAVVGAEELLAREIEAARADGVDLRRLVETLLQVVPYAGFPRAIFAFGIARRVFDVPTAAPEVDDLDPLATGRGVFEAVYGETAARVLRGLEAREPLLARWTIELAYGRVLSREGTLSLLERELIAVSMLTAMGGLEAPLLGHMRAVLRLGGAPEQVRAAVQVVPASFGEARRDAARRLLERL